MSKLRVALGYDGSDSDDWSALRAETMAGYQFTPTYRIDEEEFPTIWDPSKFGGRIPRSHVHAAVEQCFDNFDVVRFYYDPPDWKTEGESWALRYGEKVVIEWATYRTTQMHASLERFVTDLTTGLITHDGCPITANHIANARKTPKPGQKYLLAKPHGAYHQKIDAAMASVLAHEAAADCRAAGLDQDNNDPVYVWG